MPAALPARGELGEHIRRIRTELGMTQEGFADHLGVSQAQVSNWERGEDSPRHRTAWFLFQHHGLPVAAWFAFAREEPDSRSSRGCTGYALAPLAAA